MQLGGGGIIELPPLLLRRAQRKHTVRGQEEGRRLGGGVGGALSGCRSTTVYSFRMTIFTPSSEGGTLSYTTKIAMTREIIDAPPPPPPVLTLRRRRL